MTDYGLAIIGSGGGASAAAIQATTAGRRVVMTEHGTVGETCVKKGCIPSKPLLAAAEARQATLDSDRFPDIIAQVEPVDMAALVGGKRVLVETMRAEKYVDLIGEYGWELRHGTVVFSGRPQEPVLLVTAFDGTTATVSASRCLIATGSTPSVPPITGLGDVDYLMSTSAMELDQVPESLPVIGGGYVAVEQAQLFARLGARDHVGALAASFLGRAGSIPSLDGCLR